MRAFYDPSSLRSFFRGPSGRSTLIKCRTDDGYAPKTVASCIWENVCDDPLVQKGIKTCLRRRRKEGRKRDKAQS